MRDDSGEAGLRESKKVRTRADIIANAISLFKTKGVRGARSNQIAEASGVSPATLFNYFPTKASIAEAWIRGEVEEAFSRVADDGGDRALRSILRLACRELAQLVRDERSIRFEAWREAGRASLAPLDDQNPVVIALAREQKRERVRADLPATVLAEMLVDAIESGLIAGLRPEAEGSDLSVTLQARVDLILDGARKRNERVTPGAGASRASRPKS